MNLDHGNYFLLPQLYFAAHTVPTSATAVVSIALGFLQLSAPLRLGFTGCLEMRQTASISVALVQNLWPGLPHLLQMIFANASRIKATWSVSPQRLRLIRQAMGDRKSVV